MMTALNSMMMMILMRNQFQSMIAVELIPFRGENHVVVS
jgi:hypothetical protein